MPITAQFSFGSTPDARRREPDEPLRLLIMADWLGDTAAAEPLGRRKLPRIDIDNFATVMARLDPAIELPEHGKLRFADPEDFHPDALCRQSSVLGNLLNLYRNLGDPAQARQLIAHLDKSEPDTPPDTAPASDTSSPFEQLLGGKVGAARPDPAADSLQRMLQEVVAPHVVDTRAVEPYRRATAATLGEQLRTLLHQPRFQALEANWRGLLWLVSQLDSERIELRLLPLSRAELLADLQAAGTDLAHSGLYRQLFEDRVDEPWSLLVGLYTFSADDEDIRALAGLGALANAAGAPFLAAAAPGLAGCDTAADLPDPARWQALAPAVAERWDALRRSAVAPWLCLALPRLLLRQPYGSGTDPLDSVDFEESVAGPEQLVWGSPALGTALGLSLGYQDRGWDLDPALAVELEDLPTFGYSVDGETRLQAAVEAVLSERAVQALAARGLSPLIGYRNRTEVRLPGCVALSGTIPAGAWR